MFKIIWRIIAIHYKMWQFKFKVYKYNQKMKELKKLMR